MNRWFGRLPLLVVILGLVSLSLLPLAGCSGSAATVTITATPSSSAAAQSANLTIVKDTQTKTYSLADLKAMTPTLGWAGQISSTGNITGPNQYKGVALVDLLKAVGGITDTNAVRVSAKDGYTMTLSYNQIMNGTGFPTIDSTTGKEVASAGPLSVFVAYDMEGQPLDDSVGPLRLGILSSKTQVTDGHWWVKWAQKLEVIGVQKPWTLQLQGAVSETIDPATFESCSAVGCHGAKWSDSQNRVWSGVPLWYLAGRVDDTDTHKGDAYSDALADAGYEVHVVNSDGAMVKFTSQEIKRNNNFIVSFQRDNAALPDNQWPLRLVGNSVDTARMEGKIASIKLIFPGTASPSPSASVSPTPAGPVVLTVVNGSQTKTYSLDALKALTPVSGYGSSINKNNVVSGPNQYKGVAVMDLLKAVGGITSTSSVKVTGSDGYSKTLTYDQVANSNAPLVDSTGAAITAPLIKPVFFVAYDKDGAALDASTGPLQIGILTAQKEVSQGSSWVKLTAKIEVIAAQ
jgi:hypothetical protein